MFPVAKLNEKWFENWGDDFSQPKHQTTMRRARYLAESLSRCSFGKATAYLALSEPWLSKVMRWFVLKSKKKEMEFVKVGK